MLMIVLVGCSNTESNQTSITATQNGDSNWQNQVTHAWVVAHSENWNSDDSDDGIRVWVELLDINEKIVEYSQTKLPVKIELYSTESTTFPWKPSRLIYSGSTVAQGWRNDAFVTGAIGIKDIAWQEISPVTQIEQQKYGIIIVTISCPNGQNYSARYDEAEIVKP
jgi:hypothetical protein